jgi:hypothetical protein
LSSAIVCASATSAATALIDRGYGNPTWEVDVSSTIEQGAALTVSADRE